MAGKKIIQTQMEHEINIKHSNCCSDITITEYDIELRIDARQKQYIDTVGLLKSD